MGETSATASSTAYSEEQEQEGKMSVYDDEYGVSSELEERGTIFHTHRCFDMEAYAWNNLIGDGVHNLIDGLIIGVTFQASVSAGISTAIAVFFHELPQEMGDAGVLFKAGFGKKKAILFNLLSSLFAIVGCIIGLIIGEEYTEAQPYFLPLPPVSFFTWPSPTSSPSLSTPTRSTWRSSRWPAS